MRAEDIVAMAKDAARYRWMREQWCCTIAMGCFGATVDEDAAFDELIDAEMKEQEK